MASTSMLLSTGWKSKKDAEHMSEDEEETEQDSGMPRFTREALMKLKMDQLKA